MPVSSRLVTSAIYNKWAKNSQGRPVNVKHGAQCAMGKVGGKTESQKRRNILMYYYKFAVIG